MDAEKFSRRSIDLWPKAVPGDRTADGFRPWLDPYPLRTARSRGAVLVCPGGGYGGRAAHEGVTIARRFNRAGIHAFVLHYRVAPHRHPEPLMDAARALRLIRQRARAWRVDPNRIAICGFSAGGHLAASLGTLYAEFPFRREDPLAKISNRPDAMILCYPVISSGPLGHAGSFANLLGPGVPRRLLDRFSLERRVTADTPPAFLWHTADDAGVPVENSLLFAQALRTCRRPFELHVYPTGSHGLGLATQDAHIATWMPLCCEWLRSMGWA